MKTLPQRAVREGKGGGEANASNPLFEPSPTEGERI
jgi:hypothetical protein